MKELIQSWLSPYLGLEKTIYVIFFSRIINAMGCFVGPLLTLILTEKIGLETSYAGFILTLSSILMVAPMIVGGKLADVLGRKKTLVIFNMLGVLTYFICGFMTPSMSLVWCIMFASVCFSMASPAQEALLADISTQKNRQIVYSLSYMGWNLGFAVGAAIAGFLYANYLSWIFIGDAITGFVSLMLIILFVKEPNQHDEAEESEVILEDESTSIFRVLWNRKALLLFACLMIGVNFAYAQFNFLIPVHMADVFGGESGARYFGLMSSLNGFVVIAFTPLLTLVLKNLRPISAIAMGGVIYALSFGVFGFVETLFVFFFSIFTMTLGEIILSINVTPYIMNQTPKSHRGRMSGTIQLVTGTGYACAPMIMGSIIQHHPIQTGWLVVGIVALLCSVGLYGLSVRETKELKKEFLLES